MIRRGTCSLSRDDVRTDWKRLKDAGVEFIEDPTDYGTVRIATLKDPDGTSSSSSSHCRDNGW